MINYKNKSVNVINNYIKNKPNLSQDIITEIITYRNELQKRNNDFRDKLLKSNIYNSACDRLHDIGQTETVKVLGHTYNYAPINKIITAMQALASISIGEGGAKKLKN